MHAKWRDWQRMRYLQETSAMHAKWRDWQRICYVQETSAVYAKWTNWQRIRYLRLDCENCRQLKVVGLHSTGPWPFWLWVVAPQNHGEPIRNERIPGLQRDRSQADQAYSRRIVLFSIYGRVSNLQAMCHLACVSIVRALDMRHVSPPHCRAPRCAEARR